MSKSSASTGTTGCRPVKVRVTLVFRLNFKVAISCRNLKVKRALTGRHTVRPATADDLDAISLVIALKNVLLRLM